jgi:hypothetical protein
MRIVPCDQVAIRHPSAPMTTLPLIVVVIVSTSFQAAVSQMRRANGIPVAFWILSPASVNYHDTITTRQDGEGKTLPANLGASTTFLPEGNSRTLTRFASAVTEAGQAASRNDQSRSASGYRVSQLNSLYRNNLADGSGFNLRRFSVRASADAEGHRFVTAKCGKFTSSL